MYLVNRRIVHFDKMDLKKHLCETHLSGGNIYVAKNCGINTYIESSIKWGYEETII